ncbi:MAG TPA: transcription antitermination factor NusB [Candidatus Paceibacterota bacterium]
MANRHLARSTVLQTLFEWDFAGKKDTDAQEILMRNAKEFASGIGDTSFLQHLLGNVLGQREKLDEIITKAAPEWPLEKISVVDRNILRMGLFELLFSDRNEVPAKVAINEAIELAKTFGGENSGRFINGVLGSVYKEIGEPGKDSPARPRKKVVDLKDMPIEKLAGAVVYARREEDIFLALVHDIFGHWTLSKGHLNEAEIEKEGVVRVIKEEINLDLEVREELGRNEYIASDPEKGKIRKQVIYFLAESPFVDIVLAKSGGLDDARWFKLSDILDLNFYNDILPLVTKAVQILLSRSAEETVMSRKTK